MDGLLHVEDSFRVGSAEDEIFELEAYFLIIKLKSENLVLVILFKMLACEIVSFGIDTAVRFFCEFFLPLLHQILWNPKVGSTQRYHSWVLFVFRLAVGFPIIIDDDSGYGGKFPIFFIIGNINPIDPPIAIL